MAFFKFVLFFLMVNAAISGWAVYDGDAFWINLNRALTIFFFWRICEIQCLQDMAYEV